MASLWKHPQCRFWFACFTDRNGKRTKRSTRLTDRKKAQRVADEYEKAARNKRTSRQVRRVLAELHEEITGEDVPVWKLRAFVADWLERKAPETAESTLAFYRSATGKFVRHFGELDPDLGEITREHITRFRNEASKRLAPKTVNHDIKCLRMLLKAARRDGLIDDDPSEFVDTVRDRTEGVRRPFSLEELRAVYEVADEEWQSLILFGFFTGQRLGDLARLTWANIDTVRGDVRLTTSKTGKSMTIPMAEPLLRSIGSRSASDDPNGPLHPRAFEIVEREGKTSTLSNHFGELLVQAGLREKKHHKGDGRGREAKRVAEPLSFHCLRRTATTLLHEAGIPFSVARELIGHDSASVHQGYVNVGRDALKRASSSLPDITAKLIDDRTSTSVIASIPSGS